VCRGPAFPTKFIRISAIIKNHWKKPFITIHLGRKMTMAKARRKHHFAMLENMKDALYSVMLQ
jgi:hypothetical protein